MTNWLNMFRPVGGLEQVFGFVTSDWKKCSDLQFSVAIANVATANCFLQFTDKKGLNEEQEHTRIDLMGA